MIVERESTIWKSMAIVAESTFGSVMAIYTPTTIDNDAGSSSSSHRSASRMACVIRSAVAMAAGGDGVTYCRPGI
jgi:hypothetical protein